MAELVIKLVVAEPAIKLLVAEPSWCNLAPVTQLVHLDDRARPDNSMAGLGHQFITSLHLSPAIKLIHLAGRARP
jgi:hypothetical protein